jgi:hypothetical protein
MRKQTRGQKRQQQVTQSRKQALSKAHAMLDNAREQEAELKLALTNNRVADLKAQLSTGPPEPVFSTEAPLPLSLHQHFPPLFSADAGAAAAASKDDKAPAKAPAAASALSTDTKDTMPPKSGRKAVTMESLGQPLVKDEVVVPRAPAVSANPDEVPFRVSPDEAKDVCARLGLADTKFAASGLFHTHPVLATERFVARRSLAELLRKPHPPRAGVYEVGAGAGRAQWGGAAWYNRAVVDGGDYARVAELKRASVKGASERVLGAGSGECYCKLAVGEGARFCEHVGRADTILSIHVYFDPVTVHQMLVSHIGAVARPVWYMCVHRFEGPRGNFHGEMDWQRHHDGSITATTLGDGSTYKHPNTDWLFSPYWSDGVRGLSMRHLGRVGNTHVVMVVPAPAGLATHKPVSATRALNDPRYVGIARVSLGGATDSPVLVSALSAAVGTPVSGAVDAGDTMYCVSTAVGRVFILGVDGAELAVPESLVEKVAGAVFATHRSLDTPMGRDSFRLAYATAYNHARSLALPHPTLACILATRLGYVRYVHHETEVYRSLAELHEPRTCCWPWPRRHLSPLSEHDYYVRGSDYRPTARRCGGYAWAMFKAVALFVVLGVVGIWFCTSASPVQLVWQPAHASLIFNMLDPSPPALDTLNVTLPPLDALSRFQRAPLYWEATSTPYKRVGPAVLGVVPAVYRNTTQAEEIGLIARLLAQNPATSHDAHLRLLSASSLLCQTRLRHGAAGAPFDPYDEWTEWSKRYPEHMRAQLRKALDDEIRDDPKCAMARLMNTTAAIKMEKSALLAAGCPPRTDKAPRVVIASSMAYNALMGVLQARVKKQLKRHHRGSCFVYVPGMSPALIGERIDAINPVSVVETDMSKFDASVNKQMFDAEMLMLNYLGLHKVRLPNGVSALSVYRRSAVTSGFTRRGTRYRAVWKRSSGRVNTTDGNTWMLMSMQLSALAHAYRLPMEALLQLPVPALPVITLRCTGKTSAGFVDADDLAATTTLGHPHGWVDLPRDEQAWRYLALVEMASRAARINATQVSAAIPPWVVKLLPVAPYQVWLPDLPTHVACAKSRLMSFAPMVGYVPADVSADRDQFVGAVVELSHRMARAGHPLHWYEPRVPVRPAPDFVSLACGDDSLIISNATVDTQRFLAMLRAHGANPKLAPVKSLADSSIISSLPWPADWPGSRGTVVAPKPGRIMARLPWFVAVQNPSLGHLRGAALGLTPLCSHVPFLRVYLEWIVNSTAAVRAITPPRFQLAAPPPGLQPNPDTWAMFFDRYSLTQADEDAFRESLQRVKFDGGLFSDPYMSVIIARDTEDTSERPPVVATAHVITTWAQRLAMPAALLAASDELAEEKAKRSGVDVGLFEALSHVSSGTYTVAQARVLQACHSSWAAMPLAEGVEAHRQFNQAVLAGMPPPIPADVRVWLSKQAADRHFYEKAWALAHPLSSWVLSMPEREWSIKSVESAVFLPARCSYTGFATGHLSSVSTNSPISLWLMPKRFNSKPLAVTVGSSRAAALGGARTGTLLKAKSPFGYGWPERDQPVPRRAHKRNFVKAALDEKGRGAAPSDALMQRNPHLERVAKAITAAEGLPVTPARNVAKAIRNIVHPVERKAPAEKRTEEKVLAAEVKTLDSVAQTGGDSKSVTVPTTTTTGATSSASGRALTSLANKARNHAPVLTRFSNGVVVRHKEYAFDIGGSATFLNRELAVNPGSGLMFPWLSTLAVNFDQYYIRHLVVDLRTVEASSVKGRLAAAFDYDMSDQKVSNKAAFLQIRGSSEGTAWQNVQVKLDPASAFPESRKYIRSVAVPTTDSNLYDAARLQIMTDLCADTGVNAEVWVDYEIVLYNANLENGTGSTAFAGGMGGTNSTNNPTLAINTGMFGTAPQLGTFTGSNPYLVPEYRSSTSVYGGVSFAAGNLWVQPPAGGALLARSLLINYQYTGTGQTTTGPTFTVYNCAAHTSTAIDTKTIAVNFKNSNAAANAGTITTGWIRIDLHTISSSEPAAFQMVDSTQATCTASVWMATVIPNSYIGRELCGAPVWCNIVKGSVDAPAIEDMFKDPQASKQAHKTDRKADDDAKTRADSTPSSGLSLAMPKLRRDYIVVDRYDDDVRDRKDREKR